MEGLYVWTKLLAAGCWLLVAVLFLAGRGCNVMVVDDGKQGSRARLAIAGLERAMRPALRRAPSCHRNPFTYYRYTTIHIRSFRACVAYILQVHIFCTPILSHVIFLLVLSEKTYTCTGP